MLSAKIEQQPFQQFNDLILLYSTLCHELQILLMGKSNQGKKTKRKIKKMVQEARKKGKIPRHSGGKTIIRDH